MYMYMYICTYTYMYTYIYTYMYVYVYIIYIYIYVCIQIYIYICISIYIYILAFVYIHMHIHTCTHTRVLTHKYVRIHRFCSSKCTGGRLMVWLPLAFSRSLSIYTCMFIFTYISLCMCVCACTTTLKVRRAGWSSGSFTGNACSGGDGGKVFCGTAIQRSDDCCGCGDGGCGTATQCCGGDCCCCTERYCATAWSGCCLCDMTRACVWDDSVNPAGGCVRQMCRVWEYMDDIMQQSIGDFLTPYTGVCI